MLRQFLKNVLLKRAATQAEQWLGKLVRHGITTAGGGLIMKGLTDGAGVDTLAGGGAVLVGVLLSGARIYLQDKL